MNVLDRLDHEWETLARSPRMERALARWGAEAPELRFPTLTALVASVERRDAAGDVTDRVLAGLARRAPHDRDAARVLLQLLLPGCKALLKRYQIGDRFERAAVIAAAAIDRIRTYPIERRPRKIAANVLLDVRHSLLATARDAERHVSLHRVGEMDLPAVGGVVAPAVEVVGLLGWAVRSGHVDRESARLIALTRLAGVPMADLASEHGESEQTLRKRRLRAEGRLRALARV
ncbi:MAG: hypothetical protein HYU28_04835 [Actinobacteria bacterium]|nr:hypothetical protein [Actinomycetota bacterium]